MSELQSLLERVEKADGPDREIDAAACVVLQWPPLLPEDPGAAKIELYKDALCYVSIITGKRRRVFNPPSLSSDLNEVIELALFSFTTPLVGVDNDLGSDEADPLWTGWCHGESARAPTPALALLAALLRAKLSEPQAGKD